MWLLIAGMEVHLDVCGLLFDGVAEDEHATIEMDCPHCEVFPLRAISHSARFDGLGTYRGVAVSACCDREVGHLVASLSLVSGIEGDRGVLAEPWNLFAAKTTAA